MFSKRHPSLLRTDHQFLDDRFRCVPVIGAPTAEQLCDQPLSQQCGVGAGSTISTFMKKIPIILARFIIQDNH